MENIINHINQKLANHHLTIDKDTMMNEYDEVKMAWDENLKSIKEPIEYVIIGEATCSFANYFYNPKANSTSFLNPKHFGCKNKGDLIKFFNKNGVLVFDLYPLPLSTFIYDNIKFDCNDSAAYRAALESYYSVLNPRINDDTKIILRYAKLKKRCEWSIFMSTIGREVFKFMDISSSNMAANQLKIKKYFSLP